ncbi:hypothetical protein C4K18_1432 [Pseudomonas chlororaphis subsp. aurantiaca]|nr:hypothetical protein C4K18_1432 [Pseudomonas chlororaphis subsp. aurantiaca]
MATTTTTTGGTTTSFSNTPQAQDDIFTTGVIGTSSAAITEDLLGVVYLDVMSNDLGGSAKTLWSLDNATSLSTATKVYAPADLLLQDTSRVEATSSDTSFNGAKSGLRRMEKSATTPRPYRRFSRRNFRRLLPELP